MDIARVEVYLDAATDPLKVLEAPPFAVRIDPSQLEPGEHVLLVVTHYADGSSDRHEYVFEVRREGPVFAGHIARAPLMSPVEVQLVDPVEIEAPAKPRPLAHALLPLLLFLLIAGVATWLGYYGEASAPQGILAAGGRLSAERTPKAPAANGKAESGEALYRRLCAGCHQPDGRGRPPTFPALAGNRTLADADHVIRTILHGKPGTAMPPFGTQLNDAQVAAVASYVRTAWGNDYGPVAPERVGRLR